MAAAASLAFLPSHTSSTHVQDHSSHASLEHTDFIGFIWEWPRPGPLLPCQLWLELKDQPGVLSKPHELPQIHIT